MESNKYSSNLMDHQGADKLGNREAEELVKAALEVQFLLSVTLDLVC